jgi:predicted nucleotidyltransferase component of viral defense system
MFLGKFFANRLGYIKETSNISNLDPTVIEKDLWVCSALEALANSSFGNHLSFKGGTSLSKCYNLISRFSEDLDISIDKSYLNQTKLPPTPEDSRRSRDDFARLLKKEIHNILPEIKLSLARYFKTHTQLDIEIQSNEYTDGAAEPTIYINYPSVLDTKDKYIIKVVKIEFTAKSENFPCETRLFESYVSQYLKLGEHSSIKCISPIRTFWEKLTVLYLLGKEKLRFERLARHYYDVHQIYHSFLHENLNDFELFENVLREKLVTQYNKDLQELEQIVTHKNFKGVSLFNATNPNIINAFTDDYKNMWYYFIGDKPNTTEILASIVDIEKQIINHYSNEAGV